MNPMMGQAVLALGLGDGLKQQQVDQSEELRKKKMREQQLQGMGPAVASLFGPLGAGFSGR